MLFALGYNLLLGTTGLPSFGHGAFFGVGAYAFGLLQQRVLGQPLVRPRRRGARRRARSARVVAPFISHRRGIYYALLTIAFGQVFWFVAVKWHSVTGGEDGLLNIKRPPCRLRLRDASTCAATRRCSTSASRVFALVVRRALAAGAFAVRPRARGDPQNEMRAAFVGYNVWLYKWLAFTIASARRRPGRRAVRAWRSSRPTRT